MRPPLLTAASTITRRTSFIVQCPPKLTPAAPIPVGATAYRRLVTCATHLWLGRPPVCFSSDVQMSNIWGS
jgi:hypothetical protein